jgi:hypothetical protein
MFYKFASVSGFIARSIAFSPDVAALAYHPLMASAAEENMEKEIGENGMGCLATEIARTPGRSTHGPNAASTEVNES